MTCLITKLFVLAFALLSLSVPSAGNDSADMVCDNNSRSCPWPESDENLNRDGPVQTVPTAPESTASELTDADRAAIGSCASGAPSFDSTSSSISLSVATDTSETLDDPVVPAPIAAPDSSGLDSAPAPAPASEPPAASDGTAPDPAGEAPSATALPTELPPEPADDADPLADLRSLLQQARLAVARLEAEVSRQERRLAGLAAAALPGPTAPGDPAAAVAAATAAALRGLGLDGSGTSAAARQALREALLQVLRERPAAAARSAPGGSPGSTHVASRTAAAVGEADWFGLHFSPRAAVQIAPPAPPPPPSPPPQAAAPEAAAAPAADPAAMAVPAEAAQPAAVTCAFVYELPHPDAAANGGGAPQYIVLGDAAGSVYLVNPTNGSLLASLSSGTDSPVTACTAYFLRRLESTIVTGHANGQTRSFLVVMQEVEEATAAEGDEAAAAQHEKQQQQRRRRGTADSRRRAAAKFAVRSVQLRHVVESMPAGALPWAAVEELPIVLGAATPAAAPPPTEAAAGPAAGEAAAGPAAEEAAAGPAAGEAAAAPAAAPGIVTDPNYQGPPAPIMHLLPYRLGNKPTGRRHVLVLDRAGNLRLDRDNGTTRFWARTNRTQLAVRFVGNHVVMLSSYHATLLNTLQPRAPRAYSCHQLNGSRLLAASFDGHRPFRGYGINARGELLSMVTPHEGGLSTCKAHRATPLPWLVPEQLADPAARQQLSLTPLRGYLLLTHGSQRVVFNVTGVVRTGIPALTSASDDFIGDVAMAIAEPITSVVPPPPPLQQQHQQPTSSPPPAAAASPAAAAASTAAAGPGRPDVAPLLPPMPVVAVGPGSQLLVLAPLLPPPQSHPAPAPTPTDAPDGAAATPAAAVVASDAGPSPSLPPPPAPAGGSPLVVILEARMIRPAAATGGSKIWSQPVFVAAMMLVGLYQFWRMSSSRTQRRTMASASRGTRSRRGYGAGYGGASYGDASEYMYGEGKVPLQPRSALRRGRSDRPMGRSVTYDDDDD